MTKREEYNIKFYKKTDPFGHVHFIFDANEATGEKENLSFIGSLDAAEINTLIGVITRIQSGQPYDQDFLEDSEVYEYFDVTYSNPNFIVEGVLTIHRNDLKQLLEEWVVFRNS